MIASTSTPVSPIYPVTEPQTHIPIDKLYEAVEEAGLLVALSGQRKIQQYYQKHKDDDKIKEVNKAPHINWDKMPTGYQGFNDPNFGTAIKCDWIPSLRRQLVIIDLDLPKPDKPHELPIEILKSFCLTAIENTYTVQTPSGGVHIYLLSKEKPVQSQPPINIDYQTNTGKGRGKYIVANYRWDITGEHKEYYTKLVESPNQVVLVDNSDDILLSILQDLKEAGHIRTPQQDQWIEIADVFKPYIQGRNSVNNFSLDICGYLRKNGFDEDATTQIIREIFKDSPELHNRLDNVKQTFQREFKKVRGITGLKEVLGKEDLEKLKELTQQTTGDLKSRILKYVIKNKEPSFKMLADYVNESLELYKNLDTKHYFERTASGQFVEIDERRIIHFVNDEFGVNTISSQKCTGVLKHITRPVTKDYNLIEFSNGILNTHTREFNEDKTRFQKTPKLVLNFKWNPKAEPGRIGEVIDQILTHPKWPNDKEIWLRSVGHAFMAYNRLGKLVMVQGPSGTGKSTLTSILKRIFNYSDLSISIITRNERFKNYALVDKDVNMDDDLNNGLLKDIGFLNSVITGNAMPVEVKHENRTLQPSNEQIPRLFANGNTLPPVLGEGFERRLLLIHAENVIDYDDKDEYLQGDIISGKYDQDGIEWLVYTAISTYWDKIDQPLTTKEDEARMKSEYEFKSYPLKKACEILFQDDYSGLEYVTVRDAYVRIKAWLIWAYENNKISKEHRKPSIPQMSRAMERAGFDKKNCNLGEGLFEYRYLDTKVNKDIEILIKPYYDMLMRGEAKNTI